MSEDDKFFEKYLRYKIKYIELKSIMQAGASTKHLIRSKIGLMSMDEKAAYDEHKEFKSSHKELINKKNKSKNNLNKAIKEFNAANQKKQNADKNLTKIQNDFHKKKNS